jgi:hypothetical protein
MIAPFWLFLPFPCWWIVGNEAEAGPYWYWQALRAIKTLPKATLVEGRLWCIR